MQSIIVITTTTNIQIRLYLCLSNVNCRKVSIFHIFTWIVWLGSPDTGPPTSLQYKSWIGCSFSSTPQVAVAVIFVPSARLKYGGCKLYPFTPPVGNSCAVKVSMNSIDRNTNTGARDVPLAIFTCAARSTRLLQLVKMSTESLLRCWWRTFGETE